MSLHPRKTPHPSGTGSMNGPVLPVLGRRTSPAQESRAEAKLHRDLKETSENKRPASGCNGKEGRTQKKEGNH